MMGTKHFQGSPLVAGEVDAEAMIQDRCATCGRGGASPSADCPAREQWDVCDDWLGYIQDAETDPGGELVKFAEIPDGCASNANLDRLEFASRAPKLARDLLHERATSARLRAQASNALDAAGLAAIHAEMEDDNSYTWAAALQRVASELAILRAKVGRMPKMMGTTPPCEDNCRGVSSFNGHCIRCGMPSEGYYW